MDGSEVGVKGNVRRWGKEGSEKDGCISDSGSMKEGQGWGRHEGRAGVGKLHCEGRVVC